MSSPIDDLHETVFGFRPAKSGTACERLTAVVLAGQGWERVVHDVRERLPGKLAKHQLDVTGRHPAGEIERLIVECKDYGKTVGKGRMDALVGVRAQVGADAAAVITTKGYTKGAIKVAVDENVGMWRLRPFDPGNPVNYIKEVVAKFEFGVPAFSNFDLEPMPDGALARHEYRINLSGDEHLLHLDGSPAETVYDVLLAHSGPLGQNVSDCRADFPDGRLLPTQDDEPIAIAALTWTETVHTDTHTISVKAKGTPVLVLEQLNEHGELDSGRVVVDRDLFAWDIDADGNVTPRGQLEADDDKPAA